MPEMVIPGTYIDVRSEGLIAAGRIATGIVGIIGTTSRGPVGEPVTLSGFAEARELFGLPDAFNRPEDGSNPLTLVRALEPLYNNGAASVVAVRVADEQALAAASYAVQDDEGNTIATLTARTPGSWGNDIQIEIAPAADDCRILGEVHTEFGAGDRLIYGPLIASPETQIRVGKFSKQVRYRRLIEDEAVEPVIPAGDPPRYFLSQLPIDNEADSNQVRVIDSEGSIVTTYSGSNLRYGTSDAPAGAIRINVGTGEIRFATPPNLEAGQRVVATYITGPAATEAGEVTVDLTTGAIAFALDEAPSPENGSLVVSYVVDRAACVDVQLTYETTIERYNVPDAYKLAQQTEASSRLVHATADVADQGTPPAIGVNAVFGRGRNTRGSNGAGAGTAEYAAGLESISNQLINLVVLAGQDAGTMGAVLAGHLQTTEQANLERIGVIGATGTTVREFLGHNLASDRIILVAPGTALPDGTTLPPGYTAAAVAGLIASLPVQTSLTNRPLTIPGLAVSANLGEQGQLIRRNVLAVVPKLGYRIVKGITTAGQGTPFASIPTRRIVDFAKYGVRSAADPYIGRLNNVRVRSALQATLDAFLTRMVEDEALTGYELAVTATRAQEIAGEVSVTMTLQPTFSIDFIRVTMNLQ